jgi:CheY-like chemotaxis protein
VSGFDATTTIRRWERDEARATMPIIALTANAQTSDRQQCLDAGMSDFLSKPFKLDELSKMVSTWLAD